MRSDKPSVILWLRQTRAADQSRHIQENLAGLTGVLAVLPSAHTPQLLLITYDQQQTSSQQLLRAARDQDQSALLIGI